MNNPSNTSSAPPAENARAIADSLRRYWRSNILIMSVLMLIWAAVGLGCGVLFADALNQFSIGGYPLGFWFAHQGSMYIFVALIFIYAKLQGQLDRKFDVHEN